MTEGNETAGYTGDFLDMHQKLIDIFCHATLSKANDFETLSMFILFHGERGCT